MILLFLLISIVVSQKLPNIDYLSFGYNILKGNPHSTKEGGDPGFVIERIFELSYTEQKRTQDGRYEIPDRTDVGHGESCELNFGSTGISGSEKYSHSLEEEITVSVSGWGASFKASYDYKKVQEETHDYKKLFTFAKAVCEIYAASINMPLSPKLSANFIEAANDLPEDFNSQDYWEFIDNWGTHFVKQIRMGARFGCQTKLSEEAWSSLESMGIKVEVAASYSGFGITGAVDTRTEDQKKMAKTFDEKKEETKLSAIGSRPVQGGDWKAWLASVYADPMPLRYQLVQISEIFQQTFFKEVKFNKDLNKLRRNMDMALAGYCGYIKNKGLIDSCSAPGPDPPFPKHATSCRYCAKTCGGRFPLDNGGIAVDTAWDYWSFNYGPGCASSYGHYDIRNGGVRLCCEREDDLHTGDCKLCLSCGDEYSEYIGAEEVDQTWIKFSQTYDNSCHGEMRNRPRPDGGFKFCCKKEPICSMCSSCGGQWLEETGVIGFERNWPNFFRGRGQRCDGPVQITDVSEGLKLCCKNKG